MAFKLVLQNFGALKNVFNWYLNLLSKNLGLQKKWIQKEFELGLREFQSSFEKRPFFENQFDQAKLSSPC